MNLQKKMVLSFFLIILPVLLYIKALNAEALDSYFFPPEHTGRMVLVTCRLELDDRTSKWAIMLFSGFTYAMSVKTNEEMIAVALKEQDAVTRIYSVRCEDYTQFMEDRITLVQFVKRIYMARVK